MNKRNTVKNILAVVIFCMVMSIGFVCFADEQATVSVKSAAIRASADTNSEQIGSVPSGKTIDVIGKTTGSDGKTWYQVYVSGDTKGYIRGDLLKLKNDANLKTVDGGGTAAPAAPANNANTAPAAVSPVEAKKGTVSTNNVRIRKGASTTDDVVATANRGMVITVTGETKGSDGKNWYQVSFSYNNKEIAGFIRSDMVTFDKLPADVVQTQITGAENAGGEEAPQETQPQETQPPQTEVAAPEPTPKAQTGKKEVTPVETGEEPYVMPGFTLFDLVDGGQKYTAYKNGSFYIIYGQKQSGEEGWFLFDSEKGVYTRYPYTASGVETSDKKTVGILVVIVLIVVIVLLVAIIGLLLIKLRENNSYGNDRVKTKKSHPDDDMEDFEELEFGGEEYKAPARGSGRPQGGGNPPVRRPPQGGTPQDPSQRRRPPQGGGNPPVRTRPPMDEQPQVKQPQGARPQGGSNPPSGGQPQGRRPQPQGTRPQGGSNPPSGTRPPSGGQPQGRRPQPQGRPPQNEKMPPQKGPKAKNPAGDDDDIDFVDI